MNRPVPRATVKNLPARLAVALFLCLTTGCIENPGPDPLLGIPKPQRVQVMATYQNAEVLEFRLTRDHDRTTVAVTNTGFTPMDSAFFHLEFSRVDNPSFYLFGDQNQPFQPHEYFGKVGALAPGASMELGILDTTELGILSGQNIKATLISLYKNGSSQGCPFAGVFRGSYWVWENQGGEPPGPLRAIINADGRMRVGLFAAARPALLWNLTGLIREGGQVGGSSLDANIKDFSHGSVTNIRGSFIPFERGFTASFSFPSSVTGQRDSLDIVLEPYSSR